MRTLDEIQLDWDVIENAPDADKEARAGERLYDDIPHLLAALRASRKAAGYLLDVIEILMGAADET